MIADAPCPVIFTYVEGDNLPLLFGDFTEDITGYTLTLAIRRPDGTTATVGPGVVIDAVNGQFSFGPFSESGRVTSIDAPGGFFDFSAASSMTVAIDGVSFLVSFAPGDFTTPSAVPASEAATVLSANLVTAGFTAADFTVTAVGDTVVLTSNSTGDESSVLITAGSPDANAVFEFSTTLQRADLTTGLQRACIEFVNPSGERTTTPNLYLNVVERC